MDLDIASGDLFDLVTKSREAYREQLAGKILVVESDKGGVGKTTEAVEVAYLTDGVLVDADWHDGSAARSLGWRHETRQRSPLLAAIEGGYVPRLVSGGKVKPDLVAAGPELEHAQPPANVMTEALTQWAEHWQRPVVVDTHPGGGEAANGAAAAAHAVLSPVPLRQKELDAFAGWAGLMDGYPLIVVPNMVPRIPNAAMLNYLSQIVKRYDLPVATPVPYTVALERRAARTAVSSLAMRGTVGVKYEAFIRAMLAVTKEVAEYVA
ncbi:MAG: ParA family protein [Saccharothrix sp.]|nr:ParA family protein [Saccharothrix sp.]